MAERTQHIPFECEAPVVALDSVRDFGCGDQSATVIELWTTACGVSAFCLRLENMSGTPLCISVFRATGRTRKFRKQRLMQYVLDLVLPPDSALPYPLARLATFAVHPKEFS